MLYGSIGESALVEARKAVTTLSLATRVGSGVVAIGVHGDASLLLRWEKCSSWLRVHLVSTRLKVLYPWLH